MYIHPSPPYLSIFLLHLHVAVDDRRLVEPRSVEVVQGMGHAERYPHAHLGVQAGAAGSGAEHVF